MCGISGFILRRGETADVAWATAMASDMAHRGPDAQCVFQKENLALSHRRLKVLDTSDAANQPLFNERGDVGIVFNGEIYNFRELRTLLEAAGYRFRTRSDTEVIVHAFEEWGPDAFARFNGMFAFALWDGRSGRNELFLARDKMGVKPLFYARDGARLGFSSELKPLLRLPWVSRDVNAETLFQYLKFSHVPQPASILSDVRQLEPGTYLHRDASGGCAIRRYWNPRTPCEGPALAGSLAEWEDRFEEALMATMRRQMVSDVPIGCFLSGGIDSSLLAMAFSRERGAAVKTFSIGYKESAYDERGPARMVAAALGTDHHEIAVDARDMRALIPELPRFFDQPFADPTLLPSLLLSQHARKSVTVALSGDGGDELFWGYDYQRILRRLRPLLSLPTALRAPLFQLATRPAGQLSDRYRKLAEILQFRSEAELFQYFVGTVGPLRLDRLAKLVRGYPANAEAPFAELMRSAEGLAWEEKIAFVFQRTFLPDTVLAKSDRASMAYGLETRVPFLDDEMLELSRRMPFAMKYRRKQGKFLLRRVLGKYLPPEISARKKQGFSIPLPLWLRTDLRYLVDDFILGDRARLGDWLDMTEVRALGKQHLDSQRNHAHLLWSVICLGLWKERYIQP